MRKEAQSSDFLVSQAMDLSSEAWPLSGFSMEPRYTPVEQILGAGVQDTQGQHSYESRMTTSTVAAQAQYAQVTGDLGTLIPRLQALGYFTSAQLGTPDQGLVHKPTSQSMLNHDTIIPNLSVTPHSSAYLHHWPQECLQDQGLIQQVGHIVQGNIVPSSNGFVETSTPHLGIEGLSDYSRPLPSESPYLSSQEDQGVLRTDRIHLYVTQEGPWTSINPRQRTLHAQSESNQDTEAQYSGFSYGQSISLAHWWNTTLSLAWMRPKHCTTQQHTMSIVGMLTR